jgi:hypothetical protein
MSDVLGTAEHAMAAAGSFLKDKGDELDELKSLLLQVDQNLGVSQLAGKNSSSSEGCTDRGDGPSLTILFPLYHFGFLTCGRGGIRHKSKTTLLFSPGHECIDFRFSF